MIHLILHVLVPLTVALALRPRPWHRTFALLMAGMLIDLDHLLAEPIYQADRCSIGFHPLHTLLPVCIYVALTAHPKTRLFGLGLCIHILLDSLDCRLNTGFWITV